MLCEKQRWECKQIRRTLKHKEEKRERTVSCIFFYFRLQVVLSGGRGEGGRYLVAAAAAAFLVSVKAFSGVIITAAADTTG